MPFLGPLRRCFSLGVHFIVLNAKTPHSGVLWRCTAFFVLWLLPRCSVELLFCSQWLQAVAFCLFPFSLAPAFLLTPTKWLFLLLSKNASAFFLFLSFINNNNNNIYIYWYGYKVGFRLAWVAFGYPSVVVGCPLVVVGCVLVVLGCPLVKPENVVKMAV